MKPLNSAAPTDGPLMDRCCGKLWLMWRQAPYPVCIQCSNHGLEVPHRGVKRKPVPEFLNQMPSASGGMPLPQPSWARLMWSCKLGGFLGRSLRSLDSISRLRGEKLCDPLAMSAGTQEGQVAEHPQPVWPQPSNVISRQLRF